MKRYYAITMENGDVYGVPAEIIARHYAGYYQEYGESFEDNYDAMMHWFDTNDYEFADWAKNNMDWDDVKDHAVLLEKSEKEIDFQEGWINGKFQYRNVEVGCE